MTEIEKVEGEIVNDTGELKFEITNPEPDGFIKSIGWNKDEIVSAIQERIARYENVVYSEDNIKQAKADRAELNKLSKALDDKRKEIKNLFMEPYNAFDAEVRDVIALIKKPTELIDKQVKAYEAGQKDGKKAKLEDYFNEVITDLGAYVKFEDVFEERYLNATMSLNSATFDIQHKINTIRNDLETIDSLQSKYIVEVKAKYLQTHDLSMALAENKRLCDLEEKLEAEKAAKEEQARKEAEAKAAQAAKEAEAKEAEQQAQPEQPEAEQPEDVKPEPENPNATPKQIQEPERVFETTFTVRGTKEQLTELVKYMKQTGLSYRTAK